MLFRSYVIIGREYRYDETLMSHADIDMTLQVLHRDRVTVIDNRFYFNFGQMFGIRGGDQSLRTSGIIKSDRAYLKLKWKKHVDFSGKKIRVGNNDKASVRRTIGFEIRVKRKVGKNNAESTDD